MRKLFDRLKSSKTWNLALWICIVAFLVFSLLGIQSKEANLRISNIGVDIEPKETLAFLDSLKVLEIVKGMDSNVMVLGKAQKDIRLDEMELRLEKYPFIEKADVSVDLSGKLEIKVMQRMPVLRIMNNRGQSYYVAKNGFKMPMHLGFAPRVMVASGNIGEGLTDSAFLMGTLSRDLLNIAIYCANDKFWQSQIEQLYVDNYMDILLIPKVGNHTIVFGSAERLEEKFNMLRTFYTKGLNVVGWDKYKRINVMYEGQIVAEKAE